MRILIIVLEILTFIALCGMLMLLMVAHAGGHNIPIETDLAYVVIIVIIILAFLFLNYIKRNMSKKSSGIDD